MTKISPLTKEQEEQICYLIGHWYNNAKKRLSSCACGEKTHCLGFLKEQLKELLCVGTMNDNKTYRIIQSKDGSTTVLQCIICNGINFDEKDIKLRYCVNCDYRHQE